MSNKGDEKMGSVITLFDMGESPDDIRIHHVGDAIHIYVRKENEKVIYRHVATITGVRVNIKRDKNYMGKFTDIVVDYGDDKENREKREVIATILHKRTLATIEEIEATMPICNQCGVKRELIGGSVFSYIYRCPKCGNELVE